MIYKLLDVAATRDIDFSSIDCFMYGASPMSPARLREGHERWGRVFTQCYGCVEALGVGMVLPMGLHDPDRPDLLLSCGHPYPSVTAALLDDEGHEVPEGTTGEICLRTPATMREYLNMPEETAEAFKFGWLHTGDLATRSPEGLYTIVDRKKDVIVSGGFNVFSPQVETVISADASVSSVAVIGVPDPIWGEAVKAIVTAAPGHRIDPAHIQAIVRSAKGAVNTPKTVEVIDEMPLTTAGKIDKRALRKRYWSNEARQVS
jgi:fatty-acyl-CoA synthase